MQLQSFISPIGGSWEQSVELADIVGFVIYGQIKLLEFTLQGKVVDYYSKNPLRAPSSEYGR
jgi:hypothetical protein